jgi:phosphonate ABC transporter permease subunit PhnE
LADTKDRTDELAEIRDRREAAGGQPPSKAELAERRRRRRRPFVITVGIVAAVVIYALAFQQTQVDLTEITSETRQQSLQRILRALAQPDLVTYDTREESIEVDVSVPCGSAPSATDPRITLTPACGEPGDTITITGTGFQPREFVELRFVPDSEVEITLRLASTNADPDGAFSADVVLPERTSDQPQQIRVVTEEPIGTWGNRVEVFTDANENGAEDDPIIPESGTHTFTLGGDPDIPAVALVNPAGETTNFVTTGESFEAVGGVARGQIATPIGEETPSALGPVIVAITTDGGDVEVQIEGQPGFDMSGWRAAVYDGATSEMGAANYVSDTIELSPRVSETAWLTLDKILETVFLALVATTVGLLLAVPLSFIAARNIMRDISITLTNFVLILLAVPLGAVLGVLGARAIAGLVTPIAGNVVALVVGVLVAVAVSWLLVRSALPTEDTEVPTRGERFRRVGTLMLAGISGLIGLLFLAVLFQEIGAFLTANLGWFGFLGAFFSATGEIFEVGFSVVAALAVAGVLTLLASKLGYAIRKHSPRPVVRGLNVALAIVAGALWAVIVGQVIDWFYQIGDTTTIVVIPAIVGALAGLLVAIRGMRKGEIEIGLSIYYGARTVFNTLRSIEPLVMAIVFVVWVGAGPFAGSLALALHTAAALAKLYSEQVESIAAGPIEAVRATGANRLQTIIYSVVPQIVPPYISFTMYRWDINVRMSTILGFVGGGGIGSILQQNINLLQYRAAAVQMLAIAIVVASMDYASSRLRERYV